MTQDEIIRMAQEAGFINLALEPKLARFATLVAVAVREREWVEPSDAVIMQTYTNFNLNELGEQSFMIGFARAVLKLAKELNHGAA